MAFSPMQGTTDSLLWRGSLLGYTVKDQYSFLDFGGVLVPEFVSLWKADIPLKIRAFLWLVFHQRILTRDVLVSKDWTGDPLCPLTFIPPMRDCSTIMKLDSQYCGTAL
jgi:zinc-binding in reverse transcriptase